MEKKTTGERIRDAYIDFVLTHNEKPATVYAFMKKLRLAESTFYDHYPSFEALEASVWNDIFQETVAAVSASEEFADFSARDKTLTLFFSLTEAMKPHRSFIRYSFKNSTGLGGFKDRADAPRRPRVLRKMRESFNAFCETIIGQGLESGELSRRKYLDERYKDGLWLQLVFIIRFWVNDTSQDFEKTDEAIEKGVGLAFDLMGPGPLDNLVEYGKFLFRNARFVYEGAK